MFTRRAALPFLLVTVFLDILGLGIVVPIAPQLVNSLAAGSGPLILGVFVASYGLLQFLTAPVLGGLSDRYGRRPVLLLSLTFLGLDYALFATAGSVWLILVGRMLAGIFAGTYTVVGAYLADVTAERDRARAYGCVSAAFSLGFVAGPALGGLLGDIDLRLPFVVAAGLVLTNVLYGLLVLPESLPHKNRRAFTLRAANPVTAIASLARRPGVGRLTWMRLCVDIARQINQVAWTLYAITRFDWSLLQVGLATSAAGVVGAVGQAVVVGPCVHRFGEKNTIILGALAWTVALFGTGITTTAWLLGPLLALGALGGLAGTASQSWLSREVPANQQGSVQGALTSVAAFTEVAVPIPAAALFVWSVGGDMPGLVFVVAAGFLVAAVVFTVRCPAPEWTRPARIDSKALVSQNSPDGLL